MDWEYDNNYSFRLETLRNWFLCHSALEIVGVVLLLLKVETPLERHI